MKFDINIIYTGDKSFFISSEDCFQITSNILYLPGRSGDKSKETKFIDFGTTTYLTWYIDQLKKGYKHINGIDLPERQIIELVEGFESFYERVV